MQHHLELEPRAEHRRAEHILRVRLTDRRIEDLAGPQELPSAVHEGEVALDGVGRDRHPLEEPVWLALDDLSVVERAGLGLVEVRDHVRGVARPRRHERPLDPGREPGAAPAAQAGGLDQVDHLGRGHREGGAEPLVPAGGEVAVDPDHVGVVPVRGDDPGRWGRVHMVSSAPALGGLPLALTRSLLEPPEPPARIRDASRKSFGARPRDGAGTAPARSASTSSTTRSGVTRSWFAKSTWTTGAASHAPRHSSSWTLNTPAGGVSSPCSTPAASWAASNTSFAPRSAQDRFVHTETTCV